ncbi:MAG: type II toxin-antitoxin system VapC family toxin [Defluviitaleaceae bacterium]|nr:type II toxin-antitoxin system VapC family toxin [Defluviitaleaceae bacterium]
MLYLLDTHVIIWLAGVDDRKLSPKSKEIIFDEASRLTVSTVSLWEITLKTHKGKLNLGISLEELVEKIQQSNITILSVKLDHILALDKLPFYHNDPFDRLLISTAIIEEMTFLTADENIQKYDVPWVW